MSSTTIYLKLPQVKEVYEPEVYLGMIADVHSSDRAAEAKAKAVKITSFSGKGKEAVFVECHDGKRRPAAIFLRKCVIVFIW